MQIDLDSFIVWLLTQLDTDSGDAEREARMSCHGQMRKSNSWETTFTRNARGPYAPNLFYYIHLAANFKKNFESAHIYAAAGAK